MRLLLLASLLFASAAAAQTGYSTALAPGETGLWTSSTTWSPNGVPSPADSVFVTSGTVEIPEDVSVDFFRMEGGTLTGTGDLTVTGNGNWTGGNLGNREVDGGALVVASGAGLLVRDGESKLINGRDLFVDGTLDWAGSDLVDVRGNDDLHVREGGTWILTGDGGLYALTAGTLRVTVDGTLRRYGSGVSRLEYPFGSLVINGTLLVEGGSLALQARNRMTTGGTGTIELRGSTGLYFEGGTYDLSDARLVSDSESAFVFANDGRVVFGAADFDGGLYASGGELFFAGPPAEARVREVNLNSGTFGGETLGGGVTIWDNLSWSGGDLGRLATVVIEDGARLFADRSPMSLDPPQALRGGTIINHGRIDLRTTLVLRGGHEIRNEASGEIVIGGGISATGEVFDRVDGRVVLVNDGLITKGSSGTARWETEFGSFWNRGEVVVEGGTFAAEGSPPGPQNADTGLWRAMEGARVEFLGRRYLAPEATLEGEGAYAFGALLEFSELRHTLRPGLGGIGAMEVSGAVPLLLPEGALEIEVGLGAHDVLTSPEPVVLGGVLRVSLLPGAPLAVGDRLRVVETPGGASGAFDAIEMPRGYGAMVETDAEGAVLVVTAFVPNEGEPLAPEAVTLAAPAPNPAAGAVALRFALPEAGAVRLAVVDALGREVAVAASGEHAAGEHIARLDARALAPGVYTAVLTASGERAVRRLTVAR